MSFGRFILNWNPKNGHYFYPPFFPTITAKDENAHFLRGHNSRSYQYFHEIFFWVALQVLPFEKIRVGKIFHGFGGGGPSIMFNLRKIDLKLVFCYISPCNFFTKIDYNSFFIHQNRKQKNPLVCRITAHILK